MKALIHANEIQFAYSGKPILLDVNLLVSRGEIVALLGENGAGKTTTVRILLGFRRPTSGSVTVLGEHPASLSMAARRKIGIML